MTKIFGRIISTPGRWMQGFIQQEIEQSNNSKITTDANGNAVLNMDNKQVQESMRARMRELAAKR
ncbi:hypothetical protein ACOGYQ_000209 [Edwardsiella piscicida]|uniref:hypothetical protein n=1 Tax=Edwardsiella TaxID=635 RepID=UPI0002C11782|nr:MULTISPECIES: hypothetical protein [Edwardsiella]AGH74068.1 hypothetical protein ETAC_09735 [Edwardsiella piscicida C07-087]EKS7783489.1 hypothetical protein [Edwardsiella piscicida]UCQ33314.1 hypothetical protein DCF34_09910 [Edwardsiella piscicida]WHQ15430.1 hypothetical protein MQ083_06580 [Edwardsiella anguillarum]